MRLLEGDLPFRQGLDQGSYILARQIPDLGMRDGTLKAVTGELRAAS